LNPPSSANTSAPKWPGVPAPKVAKLTRSARLRDSATKPFTSRAGLLTGTTSTKSLRTTSDTGTSSFAGSYGSLLNAGGEIAIEPTSPSSRS